MPNSIQFRLGEVLRGKYEKLGSWRALESYINRNRKEKIISRKKLKLLCSDKPEEYESVLLTVSDLIAIDRYLLEFTGAGLAEEPIFSRTEYLIDTLARGTTIHFLIAANHVTEIQTLLVSRWDVRGITRLARSKLSDCSPRIWDVATEEDYNLAHSRALNRNIIAIGSPFASIATNKILLGMFRRELDQPLSSIKSLPFYFIRYYDDPVPKSELIRDKQEAIDSGLEVPTSIRRGIVVSKEVFAQKRFDEGTDFEDYGILVAQRQPNEQIYVAICGLSGPVTYGICKLLQKNYFLRTLPPLDSTNKSPPILVSVVRSEITWTKSSNGRVEQSISEHRSERRKLKNTDIVLTPRLFHLTKKGWESE